jgi:predicted ATP-dependent endonuclease of OLD family
MKIEKIRIENLLSYDEFEFTFPDFVVIVGPNNVGKTNMVRTLDFIRHQFEDRAIGLEELDGMLHEPETLKARVEIDLDLDDEEINYIREFISWYLGTGVEEAEKSKINFHVGVSQLLELYLSDLEEKRYVELNLEEELKDEKIQDRLNSLFLQELRQLQETFPQQFKKVKLVWEYKGEATWLPKPVFEINDFCIDHQGDMYHADRASWDGLLDAIKATFVMHLISYVGEKNANLGKILQKAESDKWKWKEFILKHILYTLSHGRAKLIVHYDKLPDEHKIRARKIYEKFGWRFEREYYSLWDLLKWIFTSSIIQLGEIRGLPSEKKYRPIKEYDGRGETLSYFLHYLKEVSDPRLNEIKKHFKDVFFLDFDTERYLAKNTNEMTPPRLVIKRGDRKFSINTVGSGVFEVLNLISTIAGSKSRVIILDEPALHLHPLHQKKVLQTLKRLRIHQNQIILTTHSPYFIDSEVIENTYRFYIDRNATRVVEIRSLLNTFSLKDKTKIIKDSNFISVLFASGVIVVEGDSEYLSVPILLRKIGYSLEDYNVEVINASGQGNIKLCVEIAEKLCIPFRVICDRKAINDIPEQYHTKVFNCPANDWKDYLENLFGKAEGGKIEASWNIANRVSERKVREKMNDLKKFIEDFLITVL